MEGEVSTFLELLSAMEEWAGEGLGSSSNVTNVEFLHKSSPLIPQVLLRSMS